MKIRLRPVNRLAPRKLSEELAELRLRAGERAVTLREVIQTLGGRAYLLLVLVLSIPFITPIPLPGLSTPFGLAIALIALRLSLGQRPLLSKKLQRKELPAGFIGKVFGVSEKLLRFLEKFLRPRLTFLIDTPLLAQLHALLMLLAALALLLPLPIPFSNSFPAWTILLLAAGLLERDGFFILAGYVVFVGGVFFFIFLGEAATALVQSLIQWVRG
ncbi:Exopolysaccharide synthesis, ExoD [Lacunisphaera limnophila]|uniref:Exopolysaccharide synthesis, ExoD n=1 Tax=Lacunisphaera limnophila TaxID=1838286 RepID=A0A1D8AT12_9BACT|nr:exopolysaccharide biosynthesis protein [Lacunisphaera limnophila]AOS44002.1 Exopolysaccharide synthesis, ExoD [Lacunisphaera limnophila]